MQKKLYSGKVKVCSVTYDKEGFAEEKPEKTVQINNFFATKEMAYSILHTRANMELADLPSGKKYRFSHSLWEVPKTNRKRR